MEVFTGKELVLDKKKEKTMEIDLPKLNFPSSTFKIEKKEGKLFIFDISRKRYVMLNPEEWVRQNCLHYFRNIKHFPISMLAVEKTIRINRQNLRYDIVAYSKKAVPILLVECKAPSVNINQSTFDQIAVYNLELKIPYLFITNGLNHFCCKVDFEQRRYEFLPELPEYNLLK